MMIRDPLPDLLAGARAAGREHLLEPEGLEVARAIGLEVPIYRCLHGKGAASKLDLDAFPGSRLVVKVMVPGLEHKSDLGGVTVVEKQPRAVVDAVTVLERRCRGLEIEGFLICEWIEHAAELGGEWLLGLRHTEDFGPVVALGAGGLDAEHLASHLRPGSATAVFSPALAGADQLDATLERLAITRLAVEPHRGHGPRFERRRLLDLVRRALDFAEAHLPHDLEELEFNPVALTARGPVALDAVGRLGRGERLPAPAPRPLELLGKLFEPRSIAVAGVSRRPNPGHVIVDNVLAAGFPRDRLQIIKPGTEEILGCRAVPSFADLESPVDLAVLAIDAEGALEALDEIVEYERAKSVILIPGGLGERRGSEGRAARLRFLLDEARRGGDPDDGALRGPVINGGNCLGIRSRPGRFDTMFIPRHKLQFRSGEKAGGEGAGTAPSAPLAVLSQSGAFAVARASALEDLDPLYLVSLGNQIDLTIGDYLTWLAEDPRVEIFACYVEGFRPGDGRRFLKAARRIIDGGRQVILYRAGRTAAGIQASASHTASLAGDFVVSRELASAAGVVTCDTVSEFADLVRLFCRLRGRRWPSAAASARLGALSNAGFECVAIADHLGEALELAELAPATVSGLEEILRHHRLDSIVEARNPLDVTPILDDEAFAATVRLMLDDPGVDLGIVGCVPLTGALQTLPAPSAADAMTGTSSHDEDLDRPGALVERLARLWRETEKPWVMAIDGGPRYDPLAERLEYRGLPVLRTVDRAVRLLGRCQAVLGADHLAPVERPLQVGGPTQ